ncbi:hypothetical protein TorRG33x02_235700, partial [Trema orientale]
DIDFDKDMNGEDIRLDRSDESDASFVFDDDFLETEYVDMIDDKNWLAEEENILDEGYNSEIRNFSTCE